MVIIGHVAPAPSPQPVLALALSPLACASNSAGPRNCPNLTRKYLKIIKNKFAEIM